MKSIYKIFTGSVFFMSCGLAQAQHLERPAIKLQGIDHQLEPSKESFQPPQANEVVEGKYLRIIQFYQIPDQKQVESLKGKGIELVKYLPENAYYAVVDQNASLTGLSEKIFACHPIPEIFKINPDLSKGLIPEYTKTSPVRASFIVLVFNTFSIESFQAALNGLGGRYIERDPTTGLVKIELDINNIPKLASVPQVYAIEPGEDQPANDNLPGRTTHRSNYINPPSYPGSVQYDGTGVNILMGDDGTIGPHIDFTGRIVQQFTATNGGDHGDHVAGTILGAGNLNPLRQGMAPGANIFTHNYSLYINSMATYYNSNQVRITSNSWNEGTASCNTPYSTLSNQVDQQTRTLPALLYVFSSGNRGGDNCGYGAGAGWGNITGARKAAKNTLAVGNITETEVLNAGSSRGPAQDGRLKPEVVGVGTSVISTGESNTYYSATGTSMSTPGISGTLAQLYHAYKTRNNDVDPNGGLMKAILMNSSDDLGNPGPDFRFGYGRINGRKALGYLEGNRYFIGTMVQGDSQVYSLNLPNDTKYLKVMIYWVDMEAVPNASVVLVNNLDMEITSPSNQTYLPWILNPTPNVNALNANAIRGVESLNNHEQITIDEPGGGLFQVKVKGTSIPMGPQTYYLVYEYGNESVKLTYPAGGEAFTPGAQQTLRWDAFGTTYGFTQLQYSIDEGNTWLGIGIPPAASRHVNWLVPNSLDGKRILVRVRRTLTNSFEDQVVEPISVMRTPDSLEIEWRCSDAFKLKWANVPFATGYIVYRLGAKYMDSIGFASQNSFVFNNIASSTDTWVAVRAVGANGLRSERSIALRKTAGTSNCVQAFAAIEASDSACLNNYVFVGDNSTGSASGHIWDFGLDATPATATGQGPFWVKYTSQGAKNIKLKISSNGIADSSDVTVFINDGPVSAFNFNVSSTVQGSVSFSSTSLNTDSVKWLLGDGNTASGQSYVHVYADTGHYTVRLLAYKGGCEPDTSIQTIYVSGIVSGLDKEEFAKAISIFPNPGNGIFTITHPAITGSLDLTVFDVQGRVVNRSTLNGQKNSNEMDISQLGKGVYILRIHAEGISQHRKLIIE